MSGPIKRSVTLAGHRTSISLEPIFWSLLEDQATAEKVSINQFVSRVDRTRTTNLSSALRTHLVEVLLATRPN